MNTNIKYIIYCNVVVVEESISSLSTLLDLVYRFLTVAQKETHMRELLIKSLFYNSQIRTVVA